LDVPVYSLFGLLYSGPVVHAEKIRWVMCFSMSCHPVALNYRCS
jgi:hypothetical protein